MKPEINYSKKMKKSTNTWRLNNMLIHNPWIKDQIKTEIKQYMETHDKGNSIPRKSVGRSKDCAKREIYCNSGLPQGRITITYE